MPPRSSGPQPVGTTIPATDYRHQFAVLVGKITAACEDGLRDDAQKRAIQEDLLPRVEAIRDLDKANARGQLDAAIRDATTCFHMIFGRNWRPRPGNTVAKAAKARGITL